MRFNSDYSKIHAVFGSLSYPFKILSVFTANGTVNTYYSSSLKIRVDSQSMYVDSNKMLLAIQLEGYNQA